MKKYFNKIKLFLNFIVFPIILVCVLNFYFNMINKDIYEYEFRLMAFVLACIIVSSIYYIFIFMTGRTKYSILFTSIVFFIIYFISQLKIMYTNSPLYLSDFAFWNKLDNLVSIVGNTLGSYIGILIVPSVVVFIFLIFIFIDSIVINIKFNMKKRVCFLELGICVMLLLFIPNSYTCEFYSDIFFNDNSRKAYGTYTTYDSYYNTYGTIAGMYGVYLENLVFIPDDYDESEVHEVLNGDIVIEENSLGKPNIIVLLGESFWDINQLEGVRFDKDVMEEYNKLKDYGYTTSLVVPTYGGLTANSVFELLTGSNISYYSNGYLPFMQSYNDDRSYDYPSVIKELSNNDYISYFMYGMDSYNFDNVVEKMGVNYYGEYDYTYSDVKGQYVSDSYTVNQIIHTFKNKSSDNKYFYMALTTENHMPYSMEKYGRYDIHIDNSVYSEEENGVILSYAQGIYDTSLALNQLYEYIKSIDEETIIIFFGDHLPYLKTSSGEDILDREIDNIRNKYTTEALILSNYDVNLSDMPDTIGVDLLLNYIVNQMDIELSNYYKWLYNTTEILSAYNRHFFINNSMIYHLDELNKEMLDVYKMRENLQYKLFYYNK